MNSLTISVTRVLGKPERVVTEKVLGFKVKCMVGNGYSDDWEHVLWFHTLAMAEKVKVGTYVREG